MRKRSFLLIAGACLATLSLTIGSAMADPSNPAGPRDLAGTGSDTTQGVMNGLSDASRSTIIRSSRPTMRLDQRKSQPRGRLVARLAR
jgi:hypothetical protein